MRKLQTEMTELKNIIGKMKNSLKGFTSSITAAIERISEL